MNSKMIEIRDRGTCITAIAIKTNPTGDNEYHFYKRGGWGPNSVILIKCNGETVATHDPFNWNDRRTMFNAHRYLEEHFDEVPNCSVVDVEYILGETDKPKESIIFTNKEVSL